MMLFDSEITSCVKVCWENGHHISPMRQIVYGRFLLVFGS